MLVLRSNSVWLTWHGARQAIFGLTGVIFATPHLCCKSAWLVRIALVDSLK